MIQEFNRNTLTQFLGSFGEKYIHANNFYGQVKKAKEADMDFLLECGKQYKIFHQNFNIDDINNTVAHWNEYLNFVQENNKGKYSAQTKFEPTILEEGICRMFSSCQDGAVEIGSNIKAYSNLFFSPLDFADFQTRSNVKINTKDQDFAIYKKSHHKNK